MSVRHQVLGRLGCFLAFCIASFAASSSAFALDCGQRLVVRGDREAYVRSVCGEPQSVLTRTETRTVGGYNRVGEGTGTYGATTITIQIDTWIYDFGPSRFMEELTFENGILTVSRPIGPGTPRPALRGRKALEKSSLAANWPAKES